MPYGPRPVASLPGGLGPGLPRDSPWILGCRPSILSAESWRLAAGQATRPTPWGELGFDYDRRDADSRRCEERNRSQQTRDSLHKGWALGDDRFREEIALLSERRAAPLRQGRPRKNKG